MAELEEYRGRIPDWCFTGPEQVRAVLATREAEVAALLAGGASDHKALTDAVITGGLGAISIAAAGVNQVAKMQAAIDYSSANNCVIECPAGFVEIGTAATRSGSLLVSNFAIAAPVAPSTKSVVTVTTPTAHGAVVGDSSWMSPSQKVNDVRVSGAWKVASVPSATTFTYLHSQGMAVASAAGNGVTAVEIREPYVGLKAKPGAMFVCDPGFKLWKKGGGPDPEEAGGKYSAFGTQSGVRADDFYWDGGGIGFFDDTEAHKGGHMMTVEGDRMIFKNIHFDGRNGILFLSNGDDCYFGGLTTDHVPHGSGGGMRHNGNPYLVENSDIESDDDCYMASAGSPAVAGEGGNITAIYMNNVARPSQGGMFAAMWNTGNANSYLGPDGTANSLWDNYSHALYFQCTGRPGNNNAKPETGQAIKLINNGCLDYQAVIVGCSCDKSWLAREDNAINSTELVSFKPGRGPIKLWMLDTHLRGSKRQTFMSGGHGASGTLPDFIYTSRGTEIRLSNVTMDAPSDGGLPTMEVWGCDLLEIDGSTLYGNGDRIISINQPAGIDLVSLAGVAPHTDEVRLFASRFLDVADGFPAVRGGNEVDLISEAYCKFVPATGANPTAAVHRKTAATARIGGTGEPNNNLYGGMPQTIEG